MIFDFILYIYTRSYQLLFIDVIKVYSDLLHVIAFIIILFILFKVVIYLAI